jgi:hypothetical protein
MVKNERHLSQILPVLFISLIFITISTGFAFADTIILNQAPSHFSAYPSDVDVPQSVAENFIVSSTVNIIKIRIWGTYEPTETAPATDNFTVIFHADAAGLPGAAISTQNNVPVSRQVTGGTVITAPEYVYTLTLVTPVTLSPGTYWVEIYNDTTADTNDNFLWEDGNVDPTHGIAGFARDNTNVPGTNWSALQPTNPAIEITSSSTSIPTMTEWGMIIFMVLAGIGAIYYMRRQRRAAS